ncbi:MAG: hypothetical protein LIO92_03105 [Clostridiales bacterium]|nr:hypothetical protein [Clostridiales bacterium]
MRNTGFRECEIYVHQNNRRLRLAVVLILVLILSVLGFGGRSPQAWAAEDQTLPVTIQVQYGYENSAKGGRYLPVDITVTNSQDQEITGTLQIKSMESDGMIYEYDFPAMIDAACESVLREYIPLGTRATRLYVRLTGDSGEVLADEQVKLNVSWDVPELFIGILSDEPQELKFLDGVGINYGSMRTRTFDLEETDISDDAIGLDLLDVLVVNNYRLRDLSEMQTSAIMDWVHDGGVLLLGTGERVDDTLGRFAPELLDESYDSPSLYHVDLGESYGLEEEGAGMLAITCVDISLHGGNIVISSDDLGLLAVAAKERGLIGVTAFDLSDIAQFCEKETSYMDFFLTSLLGEDRIRELAEVVYSGNSEYFTSVQNLVNTGNVEKLPNLSLYTALILLYLFLMGPALYLYLKNRELQIFYRRGAIILAAVFTVTLYLLGTATRFTEPFFAYATILDSTDDYVTDTTYINIRNPYNRSYEVRLNPAYSVLPITRSLRSGGRQSSELTGEEEYQVRIDRRDDCVVMTGNHIAAFSPKYFQLEKKELNESGERISGEINYFEGSLSGQITNNYPYALENTAVILYGNMVYIDDMEPGETRTLDELTVLRFPLNGAQLVAEMITGQWDFEESDIGDTEYLRAMKRAGLLEFYMDNYMSGYTADAKIIAFSTQKEGSSFLEEESAETYGMTMLTSSIAVNASQDSRIYRSVLMKTPVVITGKYDAKTNTLSGAEPVTLEYQMGTDISVESLTLEPISEVFRERDGDTQVEAFTGSIYFYNHGTGSFDKMEHTEETMDLEMLRPYLSPGNILTVRYVYEGTGSYRQIQLPMPMVAGRSQ